MSVPRTLHLHRVFTAKPEKLFRAFTTPDAMARWLPPNGFTCRVFEMDVRVGGRHRMAFTNFTSGNSHAFGGSYLEIVPNERLRYSNVFDDPHLSGTMENLVQFKAVSVGTELTVVQSGIPELIPLEACYLGWQESLRHLARLVEPEIPG